MNPRERVEWCSSTKHKYCLGWANCVRPGTLQDALDYGSDGLTYCANLRYLTKEPAAVWNDADGALWIVVVTADWYAVTFTEDR